MDLRKMFEDGNYEELIREVDSRFGWSSEDLGRKEFTKEQAAWCLYQVGEDDYQ